MCPDKERKDRNSALVADNDEEEREITLFTMKYDMKKEAKLEEILYFGQTEVSGLLGATLGCAVLDSACSVTVCGEA